MSATLVESQSMLDIVSHFFQQDDWPHEQLEEKSIISTRFRGDNGSWRCYAQVREEQQQFIFYSVLETYVPEPRRQAVAEFLTRANYGMLIGNFELDLNDGEVRYKTSIDVEGDRLSIPLVRQLVYVNVLTMDRYLPGLMQVAYGEISPADAIAAIEG